MTNNYIEALRPEGKRGPRDWPATLADLESLDTAMPLVHDGRPFESIGQTLARKMGMVPEPLPSGFVEALAATVANPESAAMIGRILLHCLTVAKGGSCVQL